MSVERIMPFFQIIQEFNSEIKSNPSYTARRKVLSTPVLFPDQFNDSVPEFRRMPYGWSTIPQSLINILPFSEPQNCIIQFSAEQEELNLQYGDYLSGFRDTSKICLRELALFLIHKQYEIIQNYTLSQRNRVSQEINSLMQSFENNEIDISNSNSFYMTIVQRLKKAKRNKLENPLEPKDILNARNQVFGKVIKLKNDKIHSVKEICDLCHISVSTYYSYCKMEKSNILQFSLKPGRKPGIGRLNIEERNYLKTLLDDPHKSLSVPQVCAELTAKFGRDYPRSRIYNCISQELGYSFKRNSYILPSALSLNQLLVRFKVCQFLLNAFLENKTVLFLDETGCSIGHNSSYSYAQRGHRPYRVGSMKSKRINITMVISKSGVFAFQARLGETNTNSFIAFICAVIEKLRRSAEFDQENIYLYLDNHSTHVNHLSMQLYTLLGIKTVFSPVSFYVISPIELIFSYIKRKLWKTSCRDMYILSILQNHSDELWKNLHNVISNLETKIFEKVYTRVLFHMEKCFREVLLAIESEELQQ